MRYTFRSAVLLVPLLVALLQACSSTQPKATMTSMKDPFWDGKHLTKFLVRADPTNLKLCKNIEHATVAALGREGIGGAAATDVLPPVRDYTTQEWQTVLTRDSIEAYLLLLPKWTASQQITLPLISASEARKTGQAAVQTTQVSYGGGDREIVTHRAYEISVISVSTGNRIWAAELVVDVQEENGASFTDYSATRIVRQMLRDQIVMTGTK